jgi:hypothetical protein
MKVRGEFGHLVDACSDTPCLLPAVDDFRRLEERCTP